MKASELYELAQLHAYGDKKAFELFESASEKNSEAQYRLALCYLYGKGVEKDEETGYQLLSEAAFYGKASAIELLKKKAEQGNPLALSALEKLNSKD